MNDKEFPKMLDEKYKEIPSDFLLKCTTIRSIFTGKVTETKWIHGMMGWSSNRDGEWCLEEYYVGRGFSLGHSYALGRKYYRILERRVIDDQFLSFEMDIDSQYVIDGELKVIIKNKIYNSDNTITYHTSHVIEDKVIISYEESKRERDEYCEREIERRSEELKLEEANKKSLKDERSFFKKIADFWLRGK